MWLRLPLRDRLTCNQKPDMSGAGLLVTTLYSTGLRRAAAALLFSFGATVAWADVSVLLSPQPASTTRAMGITAASLWAVRLCNSGDAIATVPAERVFEGAPDVPFLELGEAQIVLQQSHARNRRVKIARYLEGAVVLATVVTGGGVVAASPKVIVALGLSASAAHQIGDLIQGVAPDLTPIAADLMNAPLTLAPGACATRLALADVHPEARALTFSLK